MALRCADRRCARGRRLPDRHRADRGHIPAYFTATSLDPVFRADIEKQLVGRYHQALLGYGVTDYDLDTSWRDYRLGVVQAPLLTGLGFAFASSTERGDEMILTMMHRGCRAIRELGTLDLINSYQSI